MMAIRESIPTEAIIRAYMDESVEHEEQVFIENIEEPEEESSQPVSSEKDESTTNTEDSGEAVLPEMVPAVKNIDENEVVTKLSFNDIDSVLEENDNETEIEAPKTIERLEDISTTRALQRKLEEEEDDEEQTRHRRR